MTEAELYGIWERWLHRSDMTADLDTVYLMASQRIKERVIGSVDLAALLENSPRMFVHAGLAYLHEIARDLDGQDLETALFETAADEYQMRASIDARATIDPFSYAGGVTDGT